MHTCILKFGVLLVYTMMVRIFQLISHNIENKLHKQTYMDKAVGT